VDNDSIKKLLMTFDDGLLEDNEEYREEQRHKKRLSAITGKIYNEVILDFDANGKILKIVKLSLMSIRNEFVNYLHLS